MFELTILVGSVSSLTFFLKTFSNFLIVSAGALFSCLIPIPPALSQPLIFLPKSSMSILGVPSAFLAYLDLLCVRITSAGPKPDRFFLIHCFLPGIESGSCANGVESILY